MKFLRLLESTRTPLISVLMSLITYCGDEIFFMVLFAGTIWPLTFPWFAKPGKM